MIVLEATEPGSPPLDGPARECKFAAMLVESHRDGFSDAGSIPAASTIYNGQFRSDACKSASDRPFPGFF